MSASRKNAITPSRSEDYAEWYQQVIKAADLAELSPVRGCMVIKPWGYALWENIRRVLDAMFKETGHRNAYFPLFIPLGFLQKEAEHVEGFAKECAVVTHHRLELDSEGRLVPAGPLEEPLVVRPTSETIIGAMFAKWIQSYRDLPLLLNQWANVVRWEMRTRMFLRTTEFMWQEGHTAHASAAEAMEEARRMLALYARFARDYMAMPVIQGEKTESERFPGAVNTFTIEAMMQDRKALQAGTSHFLGENFARASEITFLDQEGKRRYAWTTSWGVSTRLIGAMIMTHSDDDGLVLPPRLAPAHVVILPVIHKDEVRSQVMEYCRQLAARLREVRFHDVPLEVELDTREMRGGEKMWSWVKKGIPLRVEIGPRDVAAESVFLGRRDRPARERESLPLAAFIEQVGAILDEIQKNLYERADAFRRRNTREIDSYDELREFFTPENRQKPEIHGGFALCHWAGGAAEEELLKNELGVSIRCIPLDDEEGEQGTCILTGKPSPRRVVIAKAY